MSLFADGMALTIISECMDSTGLMALNGSEQSHINSVFLHDNSK